MKIRLAAITALIVAAPAGATGSLLCETRSKPVISVSLVVGHGSSVGAQARLSEGEKEVPVTVSQSWLDGKEFRLDLSDSNADLRELRLLTRAKGDGYEGWLWRGGRRIAVRCEEG